jgi:hypothetical protein
VAHLEGKRITTLCSFFNAGDAQWRLLELRRAFLAETQPGVGAVGAARGEGTAASACAA